MGAWILPSLPTRLDDQYSLLLLCHINKCTHNIMSGLLRISLFKGLFCPVWDSCTSLVSRVKPSSVVCGSKWWYVPGGTCGGNLCNWIMRPRPLTRAGGALPGSFNYWITTSLSNPLNLLNMWSCREQPELYTGLIYGGVLKSHVHRSSVILLCRGHVIVARRPCDCC